MSVEDENQCLRRSLQRSATVLGIFVAVLIGAAIVVAVVK
jgi:hypothetical protein